MDGLFRVLEKDFIQTSMQTSAFNVFLIGTLKEFLNESASPLLKNDYRISSYGFRGNCSFFGFEIQRSQYISVRKLFKGGNYSRAETI